jgi:GNAT superfamily N-acetyltransferase
VSRLEIRPFSADFLDEAGALLAQRHRAQRRSEALLPSRYDDPAAATLEVKALAEAVGAAGTVALRGGRLVGYLLGAPRDEAAWGANVWVEVAGHAATEAESIRDMYGAAAAAWVERGRSDHYALVPASDPEAIAAWFRLGFGQQHALGIQSVPQVGWPEGVRRAEARDVEGLVALTPILQAHQRRSPTFSTASAPPSPAELRAEILGEIAREDRVNLVAERGGRIVGSFLIVPVEDSALTHGSLARPASAALLAWAATLPDVRGSGAGLALTQAAFAWAREQGHTVMVIDWRVTNLLSSRFWPARGFRTTFLRLHRAIAPPATLS